MTVNTLRPNGTVFNSGVAITGGAGTLHGVLSDDSDASYAGSIAAADSCAVSMGTVTPASGAVIKRFVYRIRAARTSAGTSTLRVRVGTVAVGSGSHELTNELQAIAGTSPTTLSGPPAVESLTQTQIDALEIQLDGVGASQPELVRVYELYLDVVYVLKPVTIVNPMGV